MFVLLCVFLLCFLRSTCFLLLWYVVCIVVVAFWVWCFGDVCVRVLFSPFSFGNCLFCAVLLLLRVAVCGCKQGVICCVVVFFVKRVIVCVASCRCVFVLFVC